MITRGMVALLVAYIILFGLDKNVHKRAKEHVQFPKTYNYIVMIEWKKDMTRQAEMIETFKGVQQVWVDGNQLVLKFGEGNIKGVPLENIVSYKYRRQVVE